MQESDAKAIEAMVILRQISNQNRKRGSRGDPERMWAARKPLRRPRFVGVKTQPLRLVLEHQRNSMTLMKWCSSRPSQIDGAETIGAMVSDGRITMDFGRRN